MISSLKNEERSLSTPLVSGQKYRRYSIRVSNTPASIFNRVPAITEAVAGYLREPDYSHFRTALGNSVLRSVDELRTRLAEADYSSRVLRDHEKQLYVALQLRRKEWAAEIAKMAIIDDSLCRRPPFAVFPLGRIAVGYLVDRRDHPVVKTRYLAYYEGENVPAHIMAENGLARAMLRWKQEVMEKGDEYKRIFVNGNGFMVTMPVEKPIFIGLQIYKTELNRDTLLVLLEAADGLFRETEPPVSFGVAFAAARLLECLKKSALPALDEVPLASLSARYARLLATGNDILAVMPGRHIYRSPLSS